MLFLTLVTSRCANAIDKVEKCLKLPPWWTTTRVVQNTTRSKTWLKNCTSFHMMSKNHQVPVLHSERQVLQQNSLRFCYYHRTWLSGFHCWFNYRRLFSFASVLASVLSYCSSMLFWVCPIPWFVLPSGFPIRFLSLFSWWSTKVSL